MPIKTSVMINSIIVKPLVVVIRFDTMSPFIQKQSGQHTIDEAMCGSEKSKYGIL